MLIPFSVFEKTVKSHVLGWHFPLLSVKCCEAEWQPMDWGRCSVSIPSSSTIMLSHSINTFLEIFEAQYWRDTQQRDVIGKSILYREPLLPENTGLCQFVPSLGFSKVSSKSHFMCSCTLKCCRFVSVGFVLPFRTVPFRVGEKRDKIFKAIQSPTTSTTLNYECCLSPSTPANRLLASVLITALQS